MEKVRGPEEEEVRPEDPIDAAFTVARLLTGETTEEEVREKLERDDASGDLETKLDGAA